jgi:hypothetical protein
MRRLTACAAAAVAIGLAVAGIAAAAAIRHEGTVEGVEGSKVRFAVVKRDGELKKIRNLKFQDLPASCSDGSATTVVELALAKLPIDGKRFAASFPVRGEGLASGRARYRGRFRKGGKRASGKIGVEYTLTTGVSCQTGELDWTSRR